MGNIIVAEFDDGTSKEVQVNNELHIQDITSKAKGTRPIKLTVPIKYKNAPLVAFIVKKSIDPVKGEIVYV